MSPDAGPSLLRQKTGLRVEKASRPTFYQSSAPPKGGEARLRLQEEFPLPLSVGKSPSGSSVRSGLERVAGTSLPQSHPWRAASESASTSRMIQPRSRPGRRDLGFGDSISDRVARTKVARGALVHRSGRTSTIGHPDAAHARRRLAQRKKRHDGGAQSVPSINGIRPCQSVRQQPGGGPAGRLIGSPAPPMVEDKNLVKATVPVPFRTRARVPWS